MMTTLAIGGGSMGHDSVTRRTWAAPGATMAKTRRGGLI